MSGEPYYSEKYNDDTYEYRYAPHTPHTSHTRPPLIPHTPPPTIPATRRSAVLGGKYQNI